MTKDVNYIKSDLLIIIIFMIGTMHIHRYFKNVIEILCYYCETLATENDLINTKEAP